MSCRELLSGPLHCMIVVYEWIPVVELDFVLVLYGRHRALVHAGVIRWWSVIISVDGLCGGGLHNLLGCTVSRSWCIYWSVCVCWCLRELRDLWMGWLCLLHLYDLWEYAVD